MPVKNIIPGQKVTKEKLQRAKELRREMTPAEKLLWQEVRAKKLGVRFRRQQVIQGFIVDFYCHKSALGLRVVRFKNDEVVRELSTVVGRIKELVLECYNFQKE
jgi:very-short-patch-repair endonuclease